MLLPLAPLPPRAPNRGSGTEKTLSHNPCRFASDFAPHPCSGIVEIQSPYRVPMKTRSQVPSRRQLSLAGWRAGRARPTPRERRERQARILAYPQI